LRAGRASDLAKSANNILGAGGLFCAICSYVYMCNGYSIDSTNHHA
jgi:hypothetical protein